MNGEFEPRLAAALPRDVDLASARHVDERVTRLVVRNGVVQPTAMAHDEGVMFIIGHGGGLGYGATSDLTDSGLAAAVRDARTWAACTAGRAVTDQATRPDTVGSYASPVADPFDDLGIAGQLDLLRVAEAALAIDDRIVDREASLTRTETRSLLLTARGGRIEQHTHQVFPNLRATANEGSNTQTRTFGAGAFAGQGGLEVLDRHGFGDASTRIAEEALALLAAPNCPSATMDVILAPDQMILQIHESIGHPLELDRILGDERNYAGTSFVTPEMFGNYRYGSELLNVTFDPAVAGQLASYAFDDDGSPATRTRLIRDGILERPLGAAVSQHRAGLPGVANSRASGWNRPPIDRMANLNLEAGTSSLDDLIAGVESGVWMETNNSWSIDDSRNKFQFGCELGRVITDGQLGGIVRNPNYRGVSATFWRSLTGVGDAESVAVMGVGNCGKGEPNQVIRVGHASPPCRFAGVEVFGGAR